MSGETPINRILVPAKAQAPAARRSRRGLLVAFGILGLRGIVTEGLAKSRRKQRRKRRRHTPAAPQTCGGLLGRPCPPGFTCVDDPGDSCDPDAGGADCLGICQPLPTNPCAVILCPTGTTCCPACGGQCLPPDSPCSDERCPREPCGGKLCPSGEVCCNPSCGICAPPDGACILIACLP